MNIIKSAAYFMLLIQEKFLSRALRGTLGAGNYSKNKKYYANGCVVTLDSLANEEKEKMEAEILLILKNANFEPLKILEYIQKQGTNVYYIENPSWLNSIGENEGFLYPAKGARALYLSLITTNKIHFKTPEMFILSKGEINKYYFIYHFYNWYAYKHNISGIDSYSQKLLNTYLFNSSDADFNKLQLSDIYKLKDAIRQDKSSIEFVFKLCREYDGAKQALDKIKDNGADI